MSIVKKTNRFINRALVVVIVTFGAVLLLTNAATYFAAS